jgi:hypothetical protein
VGVLGKCSLRMQVDTSISTRPFPVLVVLTGTTGREEHELSSTSLFHPVEYLEEQTSHWGQLLQQSQRSLHEHPGQLRYNWIQSSCNKFEGQRWGRGATRMPYLSQRVARGPQSSLASSFSSNLSSSRK